MKKIKKNLFTILAGTSIFTGSNAVRLFPLSSTEILVDHDECLQVEFEQNSFNLEPNFTGNYFRWISWDNHSFMVLNLESPVQSPTFLDTAKLPQDLIQLIYSSRNINKNVSPYFKLIKAYEDVPKIEHKLYEITRKLNDLIRVNDVSSCIIRLKKEGELDKHFNSCSKFTENFKDSSLTLAFFNPFEVEYDNSGAYINHLNQLITQRTQLLEAVDLFRN